MAFSHQEDHHGEMRTLYAARPGHRLYRDVRLNRRRAGRRVHRCRVHGSRGVAAARYCKRAVGAGGAAPSFIIREVAADFGASSRLRQYRMSTTSTFPDKSAP